MRWQRSLTAKLDLDGSEILRVRRLCADLPQTSERLSHGEPTFFTGRKVFAMFADNHHGDGHLAVWIPVANGEQEERIENSPAAFFKPPYVGIKGWVGVELGQVDDETLGVLLQQAWKIISKKNAPLTARI